MTRKRKPGRPLTEGEPLDQRVLVRLSEDGLRKARKAARPKTVSAWIRDLVMRAVG